MDTRLRLLRSPRRGRGNREATERALAALAFREGRRVCGLAAGGKRIRTPGPSRERQSLLREMEPSYGAKNFSKCSTSRRELRSNPSSSTGVFYA